MVEGSFRSVDPLAYYVNSLDDFDREVVVAFKEKKSDVLKRITSQEGKGEYDIFICVSKSWHGFVLCVPAGTDPQFADMIEDVIKSPFDVPDKILCFAYELCFEKEKMRTYKIRKTFTLFENIKGRIGSRSYFIGHYKNIGPLSFQLAAMRAAPHRYAVLLNDCVEFSKEFCIQALAYSSNWREIEEGVNENIKKATASGYSVEYLSRKVESAGLLGNFSFGGTDVSSFLTERSKALTTLVVIVFMLVYPILVFVVCFKLAKYIS
ncbi:uncharacterized protein LOC114532530 [Dendronephthya gigantea]|uniref:uncharacterized protein LOC114532530 n=1 Tax=Dendronephthya gigantea TaxID=151771 RepID=UPI00106C2EA6|nr:uncharacterized protein LOC114532530 [Dendronephthya gigantea]